MNKVGCRRSRRARLISLGMAPRAYQIGAAFHGWKAPPCSLGDGQSKVSIFLILLAHPAKDRDVNTASDVRLFAADVHSAQIDPHGKPYTRHINRVAASADARARHARQNAGLKVNPLAAPQTAYLHDVMDETSVTDADLRQAGFHESVMVMVELLTDLDEGLSCADCISALIPSGNLGAILIKISDSDDIAKAARSLPAGSILTARHAASLPRLKDAAAALGYNGS